MSYASGVPVPDIDQDTNQAYHRCLGGRGQPPVDHSTALFMKVQADLERKAL
jgi:hypothetical protein